MGGEQSTFVSIRKLLYVEMEKVGYFLCAGVWPSSQSAAWVPLMAIVRVVGDVVVEGRREWENSYSSPSSVIRMDGAAAKADCSAVDRRRGV